MVSLGAASEGACHAYCKGLKELVTLFPGRWSQHVVTDVIVRTERWNYLHEQAVREKPVGLIAEAPWDFVVEASAYGSRLSPDQAHWWNTRVIIPNTVSPAASAASLTIAAMEGGRGSVAGIGPETAGSAARSRSPPRRQPNRPAQQRNDDKEPCDNWNRGVGKCKNVAPRSLCKAGRVHLCSLCGGGHKASECWHRAWGAPGKGKKGKGKVNHVHAKAKPWARR